MRHRVECAGDDSCECECRCHDRCRVWMPNARTQCYRMRGHGGGHRTRESVQVKIGYLEQRRRCPACGR